MVRGGIALGNLSDPEGPAGIPRGTDGRAQALAAGVGWISLGFGIPLTLAPGRTSRLLGWTGHPLLSRAIGVTDLAIGAGLLHAGRRSGWMLLRALLNVALAAKYAVALAENTSRPGRAAGGVLLMAGLTGFDYVLSRRLRVLEGR